MAWRNKAAASPQLSLRWYRIATWLLLTYPYRVWVTAISQKRSFTYVKEITKVGSTPLPSPPSGLRVVRDDVPMVVQGTPVRAQGATKV